MSITTEDERKAIQMIVDIHEQDALIEKLKHVRRRAVEENNLDLLIELNQQLEKEIDQYVSKVNELQEFHNKIFVRF